MSIVTVGTKYPHYDYDKTSDIRVNTDDLIYTNFPANNGTNLQIYSYYGIVKFQTASQTNPIYVLNKVGTIRLGDLADSYGIARASVIPGQSAIIQYAASVYLKENKSFLTGNHPGLLDSNVSGTVQYPSSLSSGYGIYTIYMNRYGVKGKNIQYLAYKDDTEKTYDKDKEFALEDGFDSSEKQGVDGGIKSNKPYEVIATNVTGQSSPIGIDANTFKIDNRTYYTTPDRAILTIKKKTGDATVNRHITGTYGDNIFHGTYVSVRNYQGGENPRTIVGIYDQHEGQGDGDRTNSTTKISYEIHLDSYEIHGFDNFYLSSRTDDSNGSRISFVKQDYLTTTITDSLKLYVNLYGDDTEFVNTAYIRSYSYYFIATATVTCPYIGTRPTKVFRHEKNRIPAGNGNSSHIVDQKNHYYAISAGARVYFQPGFLPHNHQEDEEEYGGDGSMVGTLARPSTYQDEDHTYQGIGGHKQARGRHDGEIYYYRDDGEKHPLEFVVRDTNNDTRGVLGFSLRTSPETDNFESYDYISIDRSLVE